MAYFSEKQLRGYNTQYLTKLADSVLMESTTARVSIFLSYSHKDFELAKGLRNRLAELGISLYVDLFDSDLSNNTNQETATKIKNKIKELKYFFLLASNNSVESRWIPWELGIADGYKPYDKILIIPVTDDYGTFKGNEYLKVYKRLVMADDGRVAVFDPNETRGVLVESFLY